MREQLLIFLKIEVSILSSFAAQTGLYYSHSYNYKHNNASTFPDLEPSF